MTTRPSRPPTMHLLKTEPLPFAAVRRREKSYELRVDDRTPHFAVNDILILAEHYREGEAIGFTGETLVRIVTYKTEGGTHGLPVGFCIMSIDPIALPPQSAWWDAVDALRQTIAANLRRL